MRTSTSTLLLSVVLVGSVSPVLAEKVTLCHRARTVSVGEDAVPAHLNHGDTLGACGTVCAAGQHECGGTCVSNTSTDTCGTSCTPCPAQGSATATCDGIACGYACDPAHHDCGGTCVSNNSTDHCGVSCTPCVAPLNATATCNGTTCDIVCDGSSIECSGQCVNPSVDPNNCGRCGNVCSYFCSGGYCY